MASRPPISAAALAGSLRTLRATAIAHDGSAPATHDTGATAEAQRQTYQQRVLDANLESYYDLLGPDLTMPTVFVPLSPDDARALVAMFEARETARLALVAAGEPEEALAAAGGADDTGAYLSAAQQQQLEAWSARLAPAVAQLAGAQGRVFVKTSSRSPKDAVVLQRARIACLYREALATLEEEERARGDGDEGNTVATATVADGREQSSTSTDDGMAARVNRALVAMLTAGASAQACTGAAEAVRLLRTSERIYQDMLLALDQLRDHARWCLNVCVRAWVPVPPQNEWRCFCAPLPGDHDAARADAVMVAASQYCYLAHFPALSGLTGAERSTVARYLRDFHRDVVAPCVRSAGLARQGYVCDIAVPLDVALGHTVDTTQRAWVLELNPLLSSTDGALFSWEREADLLLTAPADAALPELRVTERASPGARAMVASSWRWLLDLPPA